MVGVAVGDEVIRDVSDRKSVRCERFGRPGSAIDEEMVLPLHDESVRLMEFFGKRSSRTDKGEFEGALICQWKGVRGGISMNRTHSDQYIVDRLGRTARTLLLT